MVHTPTLPSLRAPPPRPSSTQSKLLHASEGLLERTSDMRQLMELLLGAQSNAVEFLERLSARQLGARDLLFWGAALALPLLFIGQLDVKLGLMAIVFVSFSIESALGMGGLRLRVAEAGRGAGAGGGYWEAPWGGVGRAAWAVRGAMMMGAAAFAAWRLHEKGRAHRELVAEVKALRAALERVSSVDGNAWGQLEWLGSLGG